MTSPDGPRERYTDETERRFRRMADHVPVMIWATGADLMCNFLNRRWCEFTGQTEREGWGYGWLKAVHPEDRERVERRVREAIAQRSGYRNEYRLRRHDGAYRWCIDTGAPHLADDGTILGFVGSVVDVHEGHEAQTRLRESYAALEAVYRDAPVGLCILDRGLRWVRINERLAEINGYPPEAHIGVRVGDLLPGLEGVEDAFRRVLETGEPVCDIEITGETASHPGEHRTWIEQWSPIRDDRGEIVGVSIVAEEVTERRRHDEERERLLAAEREARREAEAARHSAERARRAAEEANESKIQFLANVSHELRTPLNAIQGHVQLLEMQLHGPVTPAQADALARVQRAQRHLLGLINDLLNFTKLEAGSVVFDVRPVRIGDVVDDVSPMIEPQFAAKGLIYRTHVPEPGVEVWADREKLLQILLNLLSNAVKFTPAVQPHGSPGRVTLEVTQRVETPEAVYVRVHDTGIGIPREKQDTIFDPFVQVHAGATRTFDGTGLGLAISRDLARAIGGDLRVRSADGAGSTFTVTLRRVGVPAPNT